MSENATSASVLDQVQATPIGHGLAVHRATDLDSRVYGYYVVSDIETGLRVSVAHGTKGAAIDAAMVLLQRKAASQGVTVDALLENARRRWRSAQEVSA